MRFCLRVWKKNCEMDFGAGGKEGVKLSRLKGT